MHIRVARPEDLEAIQAVDRSAFETDAEADLVGHLATDESYLSELSLVADEDGEVIGHVLVTRLWVQSEGGSVHPLLALGPVAVCPESQGHGVGSVLVLDCIRRARTAGERGIVVLGYPGYYPRMGFVPAAPYGIAPPEGWEVPEEAWMVLELEPGSLDGVSGTARFAQPFDAVV